MVRESCDRFRSSYWKDRLCGICVFKECMIRIISSVCFFETVGILLFPFHYVLWGRATFPQEIRYSKGRYVPHVCYGGKSVEKHDLRSVIQLEEVRRCF